MSETKMPSDKRVTWTLAVIVILIVIATGYLVYLNKQRYSKFYFDYNGFNFRKVQNGYKVEIFINQNKNPSYFTIRSDPRDIENILIDSKILELKDKKMIYVVIDPYENLTGVTTIAALELENVIENPFLFNITLNSAFTQPYAKANLSVMNCEDATKETGIIRMKKGEESRVYYEDDCLIMEAKDEYDLIKEADKINLVLLGIIKV
ncbi:MAG: hypothetical protein AABY07_04635 [Nanoarchaeota archaeon]